MKDRIKSIIERENLTSKQFADKCDIQVSNVSHLLSGRSKPNLDTIGKIINAFPSLNTEWLITGKLPMYKYEKACDVTLFDSLLESNSKNEFSEPQNTPFVDENPSKQSVNQVVTPTTVIKEIVKEIPPKKIERIVVYYNDNTYESFSN
jgi:transcriptional regulator with XRE-family HTH domain